ncbi:hypothetical protein BCV70DRAFT_206986 [Testicularia cyperi]|uniref:Uncharacterized protein n=1 Tax=Testicularia cyperi TaxID=1882483 RepID=A0A317XM29_9BASI|nr:hypothetical protein BCV70DRAFT_206986 [Testicularia cyperi]
MNKGQRRNNNNQISDWFYQGNVGAENQGSKNKQGFLKTIPECEAESRCKDGNPLKVDSRNKLYMEAKLMVMQPFKVAGAVCSGLARPAMSLLHTSDRGAQRMQCSAVLYSVLYCSRFTAPIFRGPSAEPTWAWSEPHPPTSACSPATPGSGATPPITLSPVERSAFAYLFNLADPERTGIVTGDAAVAFFAKSKLPPAVLGQIWAIADSANNGFLTPPSFSIALRLIGHAQRGESITEASTKRPGPPPTMEGINLPLTAQLTGSQPPAAAAINMPGVIEIKPEDRARYTRIFANSGPVGGLIDGDKAKEIFVKSKLPFDKLGAIWNLADTQARGSLDLTDFIIAMHFIQNTMNGTLNSIPAALPPGLYEQAKGAGSRVLPGSPLAAQNTGGSASGFSPVPQRTMPPSAFPHAAASPTPQAPSSIFATPQKPMAASSTAPWDVTADDKARADQFFDGLDTSKQGRLDGATVVPFFMQSKLTESVLAHIWDLSDITQSGSLNKDEFAVAMHLINGQLAGRPLPQELPSSLVPPSMRNMNLPQAVNPQQSDTQKDLFSLMDDDDGPPAPTISASSAFIAPSSTAPVVGSTPAQSSVTSPAAAPRSAPGPFDDDFFGGDGGSTSQPAAAAVPTSVFGQSTPSAATAAALSPVATGGSFGGARSPGVASPGASTTRLGSAFSPAGDQGAEFGNKSIQLQSTEKAVGDLQAKRSTLESAISSNASSLAELETRLATVRNQHESESKLVKDLESRQSTQNAELKKLREDVIREESELSALKAEKDELEQALMHDREDVRDMKKRMNDVQSETKSLKEQLEKLRKDARQQKGLVAISKKQLATAEAEQDKVAGEIEAVQRGEGVEEAATSSTAAPLAPSSASGVTSPASHAEAALSPAASVRSTNPFDRFGAGATASPSQLDTPTGISTGTALAGGVGAGAILGGVAAAATHADHQQEDLDGSAVETDPFGASATDSAAHSNAGFDDAFAVPGQPASTTAAAPAADFDDNFGDDFGSSAAPTSVVVDSATAVPAQDHGFDDAFGSLDDEKAVEAPAPSATNDAEVPDSKAQQDTSIDGPFGSSAAQSDFEVAAGAPGLDGAAAGAAASADDQDINEDEDDSSDDEDDGPEDVDGYRSPSRGLSAGAADKFPAIETETLNNDAGLDSDRTVPGGFGDVTAGSTAPTALSAEPSSLSAAPVDPTAIGSQAGRTASTTSIAPVSRQETGGTATGTVDEAGDSQNAANGGSESNPGTALAGGAAAAGLGAAALATGAGALALGDGPSTTTTAEPGLTSPVDPQDDVPLSQIAARSKPAEPLASAGNATTLAGAPSISPSSSIKTRRAPPPAPVRSTTSLSAASASNPPVAPEVLAAQPASGETGAAAPVRAAEPVSAPAPAAATNPFGMDDFGASSNPTPAAGAGIGGTAVDGSSSNNSASNFDDFDSAFEDLGQSQTVPVSSTVGATGAGGNTNSAFDDAFDNDFDFVPSFDQPGNAGDAAVAGKSASGTGVNPGNAFDDFDSAFDPAPAATASSATTTTATATRDASGAAPPIVTTTNTLGGAGDGGSSSGQPGTSSNATSGFSFEDAFEPAASSAPAAGVAAASSSAVPSTSTPGVSSSNSTSGVKSPTAPEGTYAPPPGPPPGFTGGVSAPAVPPRNAARTSNPGATTAALETADDYTGALPDDAGPVKQLCGMGFTRANVINALERSNYNTEKALEKLLASA